ncbi:MAG: IPT/TIG domain-containing protein [Bacteroidales bacterium]
MRTTLLYYVILSASIVLFYGCTREAERDFPRVKTIDAIDINREGVTLLAEVLNHRYFDITNCGFVIFCGQPSAQSLVGSVQGELDIKTGSFSARPVTGMAEGVTYYYYGYVTSGALTTAGNLISFTSKGSKALQIVDFYPSAGHVLDTLSLLFSEQLGGVSDISVTINNHSAGIVDFSSEILRVIVPAELDEKESTITVTNKSEESIYERKFELVTPEITSFFPLEAAPGDTITINGFGFHSQNRFNTIKFNSFSTIVARSTSTQLKAVVPMLEGTDCEITISTSGQAAMSPTTLSITGTPVLWKSVADFPGGNMYKMGSFVIGYHGYAGFGTRIHHDYEVRFWRYDPFLDAWERIASCPGRTRVEPLGFTINGRGYIGGGFDFDSPQRSALRDFYGYDPDIDRWTSIKDYPGKLDVSFSGSSQVIDGKAYLTFTYQDFYTYNPVLKQWNRLSVPPGAALNSAAASFAIGSHIYFVCGTNSQDIDTNEVWSYNTIDGTWSKKSDFPGAPRHSATGYAVDGKGYLGLGINGSVLYKDLWSYDPDSDNWTSIDEFQGPARAVALCMVISEMAYIGAGYMGPNNLARDMYRFNAYALK